MLLTRGLGFMSHPKDRDDTRSRKYHTFWSVYHKHKNDFIQQDALRLGEYLFCYTSMKSWQVYIFVTVCLCSFVCVCVCVCWCVCACVCVHLSSRINESILYDFRQTVVLPQWFGPYILDWWHWIKGVVHIHLFSIFLTLDLSSLIRDKVHLIFHLTVNLVYFDCAYISQKSYQ